MNKTNLETLELSYVNPKGLVKMIKWGPEYLEWPLDRRLEYAEALASAMNDAADRIQKERDGMVENVNLMAKKVENAEKSAAIAKQSLIQNITQSNAQQQDYIKQLQTLEGRVKNQEAIIDKLKEEIEKLNNG